MRQASGSGGFPAALNAVSLRYQPRPPTKAGPQRSHPAWQHEAGVVPRASRLSLADIRGKDTKPELRLRSLLHARGLRYRLHAPTLPGRPDLVFPKFRAVVFVHGCFWHGHFACRIANRPKSNSAFWEDKFKRNQSRDARNIAELEQVG